MSVKTGQLMKKTMKENDPLYRCIKPVDGFEVGKLYHADIFGWIVNGIDRCVFQPECFERVEDE